MQLFSFLNNLFAVIRWSTSLEKIFESRNRRFLNRRVTKSTRRWQVTDCKRYSPLRGAIISLKEMISETIAKGARKRPWWSASRSPFPCINQCLSLAHGAYSTVMSSKGLDIFAGGSRAHGLGGHSDIHHAIVNLQFPSHAPNRLTAFVPLISYDFYAWYGSNGVGTDFRETRRSQIRDHKFVQFVGRANQCYNIFMKLLASRNIFNTCRRILPT